ncbi:MAG: hypothetical protein ACREVN_01110, partial [Gammaproteobacteria bacterium]
YNSAHRPRRRYAGSAAQMEVPSNFGRSAIESDQGSLSNITPPISRRTERARRFLVIGAPNLE